MKCSKCGTELSKGARFCSYCGSEIGADSKQPGTSVPLNEPVKDNWQEEEDPKSLVDKIKARTYAQWSKLSIYGKVATIATAVSLFLGLGAFLFGKKRLLLLPQFKLS